jgi:hypothetical protein
MSDIDSKAVPPTSTTVSPDALERPKASWIWLKDSSGYPSVSVTFVTVAFWITSLWFVLSIVSKVGSVEFRAFDPAAAAAYLSPILAMYFGRRYTDAKYGTSQK